ncbi:MAG: carboxypeptidase-like regulatory domain-containing protein [Candidatus Thermoplasmatota archaeon]
MELRRTVASLVCIALLIIIAHQHAAQSPYTVAGMIADDNGVPIPGAEVNVTNLDSGGYSTTRSDKAGLYVVELSSFPNGYLDGDRLIVTASLGSLSGSSTGVVSASQAISYINVTIADHTPPAIYHTPISMGIAAEPIRISCTVEDDMRTETVTLNYVGVAGTSIEVMEMVLDDGDRTNGTWSTSIPIQGSTGTLTYWIEAHDLSNNDASTQIYEVEIVHGPLYSFALDAPFLTRAGEDFQIGVRAVDACGNTVLDYTGRIEFSSTDTHPAELPAPYTFVLEDAGARIFSGLRLYTTPSQRIEVSDPGTGISSSVTIEVAPAPAVRMAWLPSNISILAGVQHSFTIYPVDSYGNAATYPYELDILLSTTSAQGTFDPSSLHMEPSASSATVLYSDTDVQGSPHTLTAQPTDPVVGNGTAEVWVLNASSAHRWVLSPAAQEMRAGGTIALNLSLLDPYGNVAPASNETIVTLGTTSPTGTFLSLNGTPINAVVISSGQWSTVLRYTDRTASPIPHILLASNGTDVASGAASVRVYPSSLSAIRLNLPNSTIAGTGFNATVSLYDPFGNRLWDFNGTLRIEADDALFDNVSHTFTPADQGMHAFNLVLCTAGLRTLAASAGAISTNATLSVVHAPPSALCIAAPAAVEAGAPFTFGMSALDPYSNRVTDYQGTVGLTSTDPYPAVLPTSYTFQPSDKGLKLFERGAVLYTVPQQLIEVSDPEHMVSNFTMISVHDSTFPLVNVSYPTEAEAGSTVQIVIEAWDTVRIAAVWVEYSFDQAWINLTSVQVSGNRSTGIGGYRATILTPKDAARLRFRVAASDGANTVRQGEYEIALAPPPPQPSYLWIIAILLIPVLLAVLYWRHRRRNVEAISHPSEHQDPHQSHGGSGAQVRKHTPDLSHQAKDPHQ